MGSGLFDLVPFITCGGILLKGRCHAINQEVAFLNVYGPCRDRILFWKRLAASGLLSTPNLILGGDLNITLSSDEHWGGSPLSATDGVFYRDLFSSSNLVDILPSSIVPTWRNGRPGEEAIASRLDRFLISENYMTSAFFPSSWVEYPFYSDHAPILLKLNSPLLSLSIPFKFNHHWLESADYNALVHSVWTDPRFQSESNPQLRLQRKLKDLKHRSKSWSLQKKKSEESQLKILDLEIKELIHRSTSTALSTEISVYLRELEQRRKYILEEEERAWRLRSRATWLKWGDANTKFFHNLASFNRDKKRIWSIQSDTNEMRRGQEEIKTEAVSYFKHLFRGSGSHHLLEKISTASLYPRLVTDLEAADLFKPVSLPEIKHILLHFKKERSPGPDGWTTEFFSHFFDIVGPDLLSMVEDVRIRGKISKSINSTFLVMIPKENNAVSFNDYRPISLCNLIYKLVSKVIANRLKPFLEKGLSAEQLGFLKGRRIQDAIATAHECIHSIKQKNLKALIMKIDLKKAFDCIDWAFLRLILLAAGFGDRLTDWIWLVLQVRILRC
jgi:hypothetical protein